MLGQGPANKNTLKIPKFGWKSGLISSAYLSASCYFHMALTQVNLQFSPVGVLHTLAQVNSKQYIDPLYDDSRNYCKVVQYT